MAYDVIPSGSRDWGAIIGSAIEQGVSGYKTGLSLTAARQDMEWQAKAREMELEKAQAAEEDRALEQEQQRKFMDDLNNFSTTGALKPYRQSATIGGVTYDIPSASTAAAQEALAGQRNRPPAARVQQGTSEDDLLAAGFTPEEIKTTFVPQGTIARTNPETGTTENVVVYRRPQTAAQLAHVANQEAAVNRAQTLRERVAANTITESQLRQTHTQMNMMHEALSAGHALTQSQLAAIAPQYIKTNAQGQQYYDRDAFYKDMTETTGALASQNPATVLETRAYISALNGGQLGDYAFLDTPPSSWTDTQIAAFGKAQMERDNANTILANASSNERQMYNELAKQKGYLGNPDDPQSIAAAAQAFAQRFNTTPDRVQTIAAGIRFAETQGADDSYIQWKQRADYSADIRQRFMEAGQQFSAAQQALRLAARGATAAPGTHYTTERGVRIPTQEFQDQAHGAARLLAKINEAIHQGVITVGGEQTQPDSSMLKVYNELLRRGYVNNQGNPTGRLSDAIGYENKPKLSAPEMQQLSDIYNEVTGLMNTNAAEFGQFQPFIMPDMTQEAPAGTPPAAPVAPQAKRSYTVNTQSSPLNLRDERGNAIGSIPRGTVIDGIDLGNGFTAVVYNGKRGLVSTQYLRAQ